jgi:hypothetical protein
MLASVTTAEVKQSSETSLLMKTWAVMNSKHVTVATARCRLTVFLDRYRMEIRDSADRVVCGIGGAEKNYFLSPGLA